MQLSVIIDSTFKHRKAFDMLSSIMTRFRRAPAVPRLSFYSNSFRYIQDGKSNVLYASRSKMVSADCMAHPPEVIIGSTTMGKDIGGFSILSDDTGNSAEFYVSSTTRDRLDSILWWTLHPTKISLLMWPDLAGVSVVVYNN